MPGTFKEREEDRATEMGPPVAPKSRSPNVTLQSWQQAQRMDLLHDDISAYGNHVRCGSVDSVDSGSSVSSSSSSGSNNCRQLSNEGEFIPTRTTTIKAPTAATNNALQFVKVQSPLYRKAESQIKLVKEIKISKDTTLKETEEEWQSNLDNWKSRRRKVSEKVIQRAEEMRQIEAEEELRQLKQKEQQRKIKTFSQIVEKRTSKRSYNLDLYIGQGDDSGIGDTPEPDEQEGTLDSQHLHMRSDTSEGMTSETDSIDSDAHCSDKMTKEPPKVPKKPHSWLSRKDSDELAHRTCPSPNELLQRCLAKTDLLASENVSSAEPSDIEGHIADVETVSSEDDMGFCRASRQADSGLDSLGESHRPNDSADSASDLSQDSSTGIDKIGHDLETDLPGSRFNEVESRRKRRPLLKSVSLQDDEYLDNVDVQNMKIKMVLKQGFETKGFGFGVKGGKDHGFECTVDNVIPGSVADIAGLKKGDRVLNLNGEDTSSCSHASLVFSIKQANHSGELEVLLRRSNNQDPMTPEPKKTSRRGASFAEKLAIFSGRSSSTTSFNSLMTSKTSSEDENNQVESLVLRRRSAFERSKAENEEMKNRRSSCASPETTKADEKRLSVDLTRATNKSPEGFSKKPPPPIPAKPKLKTRTDGRGSVLKSDISFDENVFSEPSTHQTDLSSESNVNSYDASIAKVDKCSSLHNDMMAVSETRTENPFETQTDRQDLNCASSPVDNSVNIVEEMTEGVENKNVHIDEWPLSAEEPVFEDTAPLCEVFPAEKNEGSNSSTESSSPTEEEFDLTESRRNPENDTEYIADELPIDNGQTSPEDHEPFMQINVHPLGLPLEKIDEDDGGVSASTTTSSDTPDTETVIDNFPTTVSPLPNDDVVDITVPQKIHFITEKTESPTYVHPLLENLAVIAEENSFDEQDAQDNDALYSKEVQENKSIYSNNVQKVDDANYSNNVQKVDDANYSNNVQKVDDANYSNNVQKVDDANYSNNVQKVDDANYSNNVQNVEAICSNNVQENDTAHSNNVQDDDTAYSNNLHDDDAAYSNNVQDDDAAYSNNVQDDDAAIYSKNVQNEDSVYSNNVQNEDSVYSNNVQDNEDSVYSNNVQDNDDVYSNNVQDNDEVYPEEEVYLNNVPEDDELYSNSVQEINIRYGNNSLYSSNIQNLQIENDDQYELDECADQLSPLDVIDQIEMKLMQQLEQEMIEDLTDDANGQLEDEVNRQLLYLSDDADLLDDFDAPRNMVPPSEPPPPPPPEPETSEKANPFQRINSTKRIKKELWRRRSDFLGLDSPEAISVDDLPPPPPGLEELLKSEMEQQREQRLFLEKQLSLNEIEYNSISETPMPTQYSYNEDYNSDYLLEVLDAEVYDAVADDPEEPEDWKIEDECQIPESESMVVENNLENVERENRLNGGSQNKAKTHIQSLGAAPKAKIMDSNKWITQNEKHGALVKQKSVDPVLSGGSYNQNFWLAQEAERRNAGERAHVPVDRRYSMPPAYSNDTTSRQPNVTLRTWNEREAQPPLRPKSAIWQERTASIVQPHPPLSDTISSQRSSYAESSSVSGDEQPSLEVSHQCSYCGSALTEGSAMGIDALQLYFHIECFRCCACHLQLGNGSCGTDVQVKNGRLYCPKCFLLD